MRSPSTDTLGGRGRLIRTASLAVTIALAAVLVGVGLHIGYDGIRPHGEGEIITEDLRPAARAARALTGTSDVHSFAVALRHRLSLEYAGITDDHGHVLAGSDASLNGRRFGSDTLYEFAREDNTPVAAVEQISAAIHEDGVALAAPDGERYLGLAPLPHKRFLVLAYDLQRLLRRRQEKARRVPSSAVALAAGGILVLILGIGWSSITSLRRRADELSRALVTNELQAQELGIARDEALAASRLKSEFLANMSHELRTPMNGVIGMTELLLSTGLDVTQRDFAETIQSSGEALLAVINDVLDFSKLEAGKIVIEAVEMDLHSAVEDVARLLAAAAHGKGLELVTIVEPGVPEHIASDPVRVRQILTNLVGNAVKFTSSGEVTIHVSVDDGDTSEGTADGASDGPADGAADGAPLWIRCAVTDTGIGISPEAQGGIFQAFVQADGSTTRRFGGSGLGLAICRQLAELLDGQIGVESTPGSGSTFWFTIRTHSVVRSASADTGAPVAAPSCDLAGARVLIVDDSATNRKALGHLIAGWNGEPLAVADGAAALAILDREAGTPRAFDLVLLDHQMPDMDGIQVATEMQADERLRHVPRMLLTSTGQVFAAEILASVGISAQLSKPVRRSQLAAAITSELHEDSPSSAPGANVAGEEAAATLPLLRTSRILLAEDNVVNQRVALAHLRKLGLTADTVRTGSAAVEACRDTHYDVVLMDLHMPGVDGFAAARSIREIEDARDGGRRAAIVALTADSQQESIEACLADGMDDFLTKPFDSTGLAAVLSRWLRDSAGHAAG